MSHFIDGFVEPALWGLADWSLRWAVLIGGLAVWLIVGRPRRAGSRHLVCWAVLLAGLLLPILPRWGPGFGTARSTAVAEEPTPIPPRPTAPAPVEPPMDHPGLSPSSPAGEKPVAVDRAAAPTSAPAVSPGPSETPPAPVVEQDEESLGARRLGVLCLAGIWIAGVTVYLGRWVLGWVLLRSIRRSAVPADGAPAQLLAACRAELGLHRPVALASHLRVQSPVTLGLVRPLILVPPSWAHLPEPEQRGSLLHELAHVARHDDWLALLLELVRAGFFFHPLVRWLLARLERERELLCDETAIRHGIDPRQYVRMLLAFARQPGRLALAGSLYPLRFGQRRTVKTRIHHLLEENMDRWITPPSVGRGLALAAVVIMPAVGLGSLRVKALERDEPPAESAPESPTTRPSSDLPAGERQAHAARTKLPLGVAPHQGQAVPPPQKPSSTAASTEITSPYRVGAWAVLKIRATPTLPGWPINNVYLVEPSGKVLLGIHGRVAVSGLTLEEATAAIAKRLSERIRAPRVSVSLAGWVSKWRDNTTRRYPYQIRPRHVLSVITITPHANQTSEITTESQVVDLDGKIDLGPGCGKVRVAGLSLEEAEKAANERLQQVTSPQSRMWLTIGGWEKDWRRLEDEDVQLPAQPSADLRPKKEGLRYGGKTFDQWRTELMTGLKPEVRIDGIKALRILGANGYGAEAATTLIEVMKGYSPRSQEKDEQAVIRAALDAIGKIGVAAVPPLLKGLRNDNANVRSFAAIGLGRLQATARPAIPALLEAMRDREASVRDDALQAIRAIDLKAPGYLDALIQALKDEDILVRIDVADSLRMLGPSAAKAVPMLVESLKDKDAQVRGVAAGALGAIGPAAGAAAPALASALKDPDYEVRRNAIVALRAVQPKAEVVVPALIGALKAQQPFIRHHAMDLLGSLGPDAKAAVPALIQALNNQDDWSHAIPALGSMGPAAKEAVPALNQILATGRNLPRGFQPPGVRSPDVYGQALEALSKINPEPQK